MELLLSFSDYLVPSVIVFIVTYGLLKNINVFEAFIEGATEGVKIVVSILPTLVGLLIAVGMLRVSGALDGIVRLIEPLLSFSNFPSEAVPVALLRTFSSSASMGLIVDIFEHMGPDSFVGRLVSVIAGCTESLFYTFSVYFMSINIKDTRYTVPVALLSSLAGIIASYYFTIQFFYI